MSQSAVFMLPKKSVPSTVVWTVRRWCLDCAAGPEESSTSEVQRLQKFCRRMSVRGTTQVGTSADCRERRVLSDTRQQSSAKQRDACPNSDWRTRHATLNLTRSRMGSQWSSRSTGVMWSGMQESKLANTSARVAADRLVQFWTKIPSSTICCYVLKVLLTGSSSAQWCITLARVRFN